MTKIIKIILLLFVLTSIGYLVAKEYGERPVLKSEQDLKTETSEISKGMVFYYFHGSRRCPTCMAIEKYAHEAIMPYISDNQLTWKVVNIETKNNEHFIYDFNLTSSGPVIVEYDSGKVKRWQSLDRVWQLVRDQGTFEKYVKDEVERFIK
ncbi:MAG: nitrophenyl compound nitroreductase subunit ArsF family protein [Pseudomonadota bacterium]